MSESPRRVITFSEEEVDLSLDRCFSDAFVKSSTGVVLGGLTSILFLKRRIWPLWVGFGFGLGFAYGTCEKRVRTITDAAELKLPFDL